MTWKEIVYPSPNLQELYRLALSICAATILLGAWGDINYHPALLAVLPALFIYQFSSYFTANESISLRWRQRLAVVMELIDGVITGFLLAFVGFDPMVMLGLANIFSHHSRLFKTYITPGPNWCICRCGTHRLALAY